MTSKIAGEFRWRLMERNVHCRVGYTVRPDKSLGEGHGRKENVSRMRTLPRRPNTSGSRRGGGTEEATRTTGRRNRQLECALEEKEPRKDDPKKSQEERERRKK